MQNSKWMRFLLITLSVVMVLSLFACGDNGSTTEETTVDNTEDTTVEDTTVEDTTVEDTTVEDTTVEDTTVEDTTVEDTTVEDTTVEDTTVEDTTVEDTTVEETTVEEEETVEGYISGKAIYNAGVHATYTATLNADGTVTITSNKDGADQAIDLTAFATITAKYMVVKYKTDGATMPYVYATTGDASKIGGYANASIIADGEWHYMAVDLTKVSNSGYVLSENVVFLRLDICEGSAGESMTIEYVQLMDDISEIEHLLPKNYITNIDHVFVDGNQDTDYKSSSSVTATSIYFNCWTAVDGCTATAARYVVTDANGDKTVVEIPLLTKEEEADLRFFTRDDITEHVINVKGYSADTLGYVFNVTADLSAFAGQTVSFTLVIETADGASVTFHKVNVTVPALQ